MTVSEVETTMSASELGEWREYLRLDPRGEDSNAVLLAQLLSMFAAAHSDPKSSRKPPTAEDFLAGIYPDRNKGDARDPANWTDKQKEVWARYQKAKVLAASAAMKGKANGNGR